MSTLSKRSKSILLVLVLLAFAFSLPPAAADSNMGNAIMLSGDLQRELSPQATTRFTNDLAHLAAQFQCAVIVHLNSTLPEEYGTMEEWLTAEAARRGQEAIILLYVQDLAQALIHCPYELDTAPALELLCSNGDALETRLLDTAKALAQQTEHYREIIFVNSLEEQTRQQAEAMFTALRECFDGPIVLDLTESSNSSSSELLALMRTVGTVDFAESLVIVYDPADGDCAIAFDAAEELDLEKMEAAFASGGIKGLEQGVNKLTQAYGGGSSLPWWGIVIGGVGLVICSVIVVVLLQKKHKQV